MNQAEPARTDGKVSPPPSGLRPKIIRSIYSLVYIMKDQAIFLLANSKIIQYVLFYYKTEEKI